jgi:type IV pilus assembly protein PilN
MAKINLLPWRAERREQRKREFFTQLIFAGAAAIVVVLIWGMLMSWRIGDQNDRNAYLTDQIKQLDAKITEIKDLQKVKDELLARKQIIEKLQSSRSQMVHLFDEIVKTIPAGARLTGMKQQGDKLTLDGVAESNATVAEYMRNIEASPWMGPAQLVRTENLHTDSNTPYEFELVVSLGTPNTDQSGAEGTPASGASSAAPASASSVAPVATTAAASTPMSSAVPTSAPSAAVVSGSAKATGPMPVSAPVTSTAASSTARAPAASTTKGGAGQ